MAVDEIVIGRAGHIGNVGRVHPHLAPHPALGQRLVLACQQAGQRLLLLIEIAGLLLLLGEVGMRVREAPVGQHEHMFAVIGDRVGARGIDDRSRHTCPSLPACPNGCDTNRCHAAAWEIRR